MKATLQILIVSIFLILPLNLLAQVEPTDNNGNGFRNVSTLEHLRWISENPDSWGDNFELDNDIDASDTENWNEGAGWTPIGNDSTCFTGFFEGNGFEIQNLNINRIYPWEEPHKLGFIGCLSGTVQNIGIVNIHIKLGDVVGGLVGLNQETGKILNSYSKDAVIYANGYVGALVGINRGVVTNNFSTGIISGYEYSGGLIGINSGIVKNSYNIAEVTGEFYVGGLIGINSGTVKNSYNIAEITEGFYVGGLVGENSGSITDSYNTGDVSDGGGGLVWLNDGHITNCYSTGTVTGGGGGLVWLNDGHITNCYSTGAVTGGGGGLVWLNDGAITNSYSTGAVTGDGGGLIGDNGGEVINSFSTGDISGHIMVGGLIGANGGRVINCYSSGAVSGDYYIGGLMGGNSSRVINCYSTGDVSGIDWVGGLVGDNSESWDEAGIITNSFSIGKVIGTGSKVGGLVGENEGSVSCSFWDVESSGQDSSAGGTGKTTEEMKNLSTYIDTGWNFDFIWNIDDDYPYIDIDFSYRPTDTNGNGFLNISTINDLRWFSESGYDLDKDWELDNSIDATDTKYWNCGDGWLPIYRLSTTFEGNGYEIGNLFINRPLQNFIGLFSVSSGKIQNIGLTNANIIGDEIVGGIVGMNGENGTIFNCYTTGSVSGDETVGGLVGYNDNGLILSNYFTGSVNGNFAVGGLVGVCGYYDTYNNCSIKNSFSDGTVSGNRALGGLVGINHGSISNSYSSSVVSGGNGDGGLVDWNFGTVSCSFWDIESSGQETSDGGTGKTTEEMKNLSTYLDSGWNFDFYWNIDNDYPFIDIDFSYQPTDTNDNGFINISTLNDLRWLSETGYDLDKDWELDNNINASDTENWNCGEGWLPIDIFSGTFEGNGYEIDSLYINKPEHGYLGFFSGLNGTIQNLGITNANIIGYNYVGSLVGSNNGSILKSYSNGIVSGNYSIGGLIGENQYSGKINKSYSTGEVDGYHAGGLVGTNSGSITNSYSRAVVSGGEMLGGLVGSCYGNNFGENRNRIKNCYSTGEVVSNSDFFVSGLIGYIEIYWGYNSVESCFWDVETSGLETSAGGTGKSTTEMKTKSTFTDVDWDFEVIWSINPDINDGYPYLLMGNPTSVAETQIDKQEPYNFNVYPNPFAGSLNMEFDLPTEMPISIVLIDNSGKTIKHIHDGIGNAGRNYHIVEFTELSSGLYFLILSANGEMLTQKVISVR